MLPRPDDLVKGAFLFGGVIAANLASGNAPPTDAADLGRDLLQVAALWVAVEVLIYQARYQWNDIVGRSEDWVAPTASTRGRLPESPGAHHASWLVILLRLYLVIVIVTIDWSPGSLQLAVDRALLIAVAATAATAIIYESLRAWLRHREDCSKLGMYALLAAVGLGYPVRFTIGWFAVQPDGVTDGFGWLVAGFWLVGIQFVALTWGLEAADHHYYDADGVATPIATSLASLRRKPHLLPVLVSAGLPPGSPIRGFSKPGDGGEVPILRYTQRRWKPPPWRLAAAAFLATTGWHAPVAVGLPATYTWAWAVIPCLIALLPVTGRGALGATTLACVTMLSVQVAGLVDARADLDNIPLSEIRIALLFLIVMLPAAIQAFDKLTYRKSRGMAKRILLGSASLILRLYGLLSGDGWRPARSDESRDPQQRHHLVQ
ncbi:hypothetical protein [Nocardioides limicola]|uniref:hypothetical protein n=1 Tax=Nocardioides limicola TaxID=2803368 RepID=UPI00193BEE8E|nr:hypothetical protein [Nocardioides sp. DJM-14]